MFRSSPGFILDSAEFAEQSTMVLLTRELFRRYCGVFLVVLIVVDSIVLLNLRLLMPQRSDRFPCRVGKPCMLRKQNFGI